MRAITQSVRKGYVVQVPKQGDISPFPRHFMFYGKIINTFDSLFTFEAHILVVLLK